MTSPKSVSLLQARDAVSLGARILCDHFTLLTDLSETMGSRSTVVEKAETQRDKVMEMTIDDMDLSVRSYNCLKRAGIHSVRQLVEFSENDLLNIRNFGAKSIEEVKDKLISMDLNLKQ